MISFLVVAVQARDIRIKRLEQLDYQKALALDERRRREPAQRRKAA